MIGIIAAVVFVIIFGGICLVLIVDNTIALNEEKALRQELRKLEAEADALGPNPTDAQLAQLREHVDAYKERFKKWKSSPFVVGAP